MTASIERVPSPDFVLNSARSASRGPQLADVSASAPASVSWTGGALLAEGLRVAGIRHIFGVAGESYLGFLDGVWARRASLRFITCRHEGAASYAAEAMGKLTRLPGVVAVTRGPGVTHATSGLHVACQDSTPLLLLAGHVNRGLLGREAFQEIEHLRFLNEITKWVQMVTDPSRIPELLAQGLYRAMSGRPGPVALIFPEDVLTEQVRLPTGPTDSGAPVLAPLTPPRVAYAHPGPEALLELQRLLERAERPLCVLGGHHWSRRGLLDIRRFCEKFALPVLTSFRSQDLFENTHPLYKGCVGSGMPEALRAHVERADFWLVVGDRLSEIVSFAYELVAVRHPTQCLVHVFQDANELGRNFEAHLKINAGLDQFAAGAATLEPRSFERARREAWLAPWTQTKAEVIAHAAQDARQAACALDLRLVVEAVQARAAQAMRDAGRDGRPILCHGAGNATAWGHLFWEYGPVLSDTDSGLWKTQVSPQSGSMGYGVPAGVAAKLANPHAQVVVLAGDGDFQMSCAELATLRQYKLAVLILVFDNEAFGTIRLHQARRYPGRELGTRLDNPDFAALARAYGFHGVTLTSTAELAAVCDAAFEHLNRGQTVLVHVKMPAGLLAPGVFIDEDASVEEASAAPHP